MAGWEVPDWVSPDGRLRVRFAPSSTRGNLTINQVRVVDERDGAVLLDGWSAAMWDWEGAVAGADGARLTLAMRRFPGSTSCVLVLDADARTYEVRDATRGGKGLRALREALGFAGLREA